jgi:hypothetical protein
MEKNTLLRIDKIWAAISVDEEGNEGLVGFYSAQTKGWMPLVAADEARLVNVKEMAQKIARKQQCLVRLIELSTRVEIQKWDGRQ